MNAKQHIDMLLASALTVLAVVSAGVIMFLMLLLLAGFSQWRVDENMRSLEVTEHKQIQTETNWR